jgi:ABC-type bacteriocin/lantibiotic exporter with double-glycine peptidase domain
MPESSSAIQPNPTYSALKRFFKLVSTEKREIIHIYVFAIMAGLISLSLPLGIQAVFNFVMGGEVTTSWVVLVIFVIVGVLGNGLLQILQISIIERMQQRIFTHAAFEFAFRIPRLRVDAIRGQNPQELVNRFFDTLTIQKGLSKILLDLSTSSLQIVFGLILLSFYHSFFIFLSLGLLLLLLLVIRLTGPTGLRSSLQESKYKYKVVYWLQELARTIESFKFAGATPLPLEKTDALVTNYLAARTTHFRVLMINYGVILAFKVLIIAALLIIGSFLVFNNELNVGQFVAMEIVVILLTSSVEKLILSLENIYDTLTALEKIAAVTDLPLETELGESLSTTITRKGIHLKIKDLTLKFPDHRLPALSNLTLDAPPRSRINIVSQSETFAAHFFRLLGGFYYGYSGKVTLNDLPLQNLNLDSLRAEVEGFTSFQEIFEGTLRQNISRGIQDIDTERILELIHLVGLDEFLSESPEGLDRPLSSGGGDLGEGILHRIILARSLASHPTILLLDEPFHVFSNDEIDAIFSYIDHKMPSSTVIVTTYEPLAHVAITQSYTVEKQSLVRNTSPR